MKVILEEYGDFIVLLMLGAGIISGLSAMLRFVMSGIFISGVYF